VRGKKDKKIFLEANWERLLSANYVVDPSILQPHIPEGTELELHNGKCYVSLVAFRYSETKLLKIKVPFHQTFEEINLRFYVKRKIETKEWRSEVAFTKLFFPKRTLTAVAKRIYKENYETYEMQHRWKDDEQFLRTSYGLNKDKWHRFEVITERKPLRITENTDAFFFSKHYWGTSQIDSRSCTIYEIEHPDWSTYKTIDAAISFDFKHVFGEEFASLTTAQPESIYLFDGSPVTVYKKSILK